MKEKDLRDGLNEIFDPIVKEMNFTDLVNIDEEGLLAIKKIFKLLMKFNDEFEDLKKENENLKKIINSLQDEINKIRA